MSMLIKARQNRLNAIVSRLDRLDMPMTSALPARR